MIPLTLRKIFLLLPFNPRHALYRFLKQATNKDLKTVLDAACGHGGNGIVTKYYNNKLSIVGFDIFLPYLHECKHTGAYDNLVLADLLHPPFAENSVDAVFFTEAIEHIEKVQAKKALRELEKLSKRLILTTPLGLVLRNENEISDGNIHQFHLSGWLPNEFEERGYSVWGRYPRSLGHLRFLLFLPPFCLLNLVHLPITKSFNIVALRVLDE
jgi:SAM-dependent methyltransferase